MAIGTLGSWGIAQSNSATGSNSLVFTTATTALVSGNEAIVHVVSDNVGTVTGATNTHSSITGLTGTWTKLGEYTYSPTAAAGDGGTVSTWKFRASGAVAIGSTFTINFSASIVEKCASGWAYSVGASNTLSLTTGTNPVNNSLTGTNFGSVSFSGLPSIERLYVRGLGKEVNAITAMTATAGYTLMTNQRSRTNTAAVSMWGEFIIVTGTGSTSNPTLGTSADTVGQFTALEETAIVVADTWLPVPLRTRNRVLYDRFRR